VTRHCTKRMVLQAKMPASQLTVIFQMMSVVTDSRPTDRSVIETDKSADPYADLNCENVQNRLKGIVTEISNLVASGSNE
jgi:hypothetical protein